MECLNTHKIIGEIVEPLEFSHSSYGEKIYRTYIKSNRTSENADILEVSIPNHSLFTEINVGDTVEIIGRISSQSEKINGRNKLNIFIFANEVTRLMDRDTPHENTVTLEGFICKEPMLRSTPNGREITDLLLASNSRFNKSTYIPSIIWGRNAKYLANACGVQTKLKVLGRLQSRIYVKNGVNMTAYELSVSKFDVVEDGNNEDI